MTKNRIIGIISCGSIGERYIKIFKKLKFKVFAWNRSKDKANKITKKYNIKVFNNLNDLLNIENLDYAFICSPNSFHINHAIRCAKKVKNIFIEKPLSNNSSKINLLLKLLKKKKIKSHVSCNLRFHPGPQFLKNFIKTNKLGKIIYVNIWAGSFLPDWHKNQNYKKLYTLFFHQRQRL